MGYMRNAFAGLGLQDQAIVGGLDALGKRFAQGRVVEDGGHVGQDGAFWADAVDPGEDFVEVGVELYPKVGDAMN